MYICHLQRLHRLTKSKLNDFIYKYNTFKLIPIHLIHYVC